MFDTWWMMESATPADTNSAPKDQTEGTLTLAALDASFSPVQVAYDVGETNDMRLFAHKGSLKGVSLLPAVLTDANGTASTSGEMSKAGFENYMFSFKWPEEGWPPTRQADVSRWTCVRGY